MAKRKKKIIKWKSIVFCSISIFAIIYFAISLVTYSLDIKSLKEQEKNLNNELEELKKESEDLKIEIEKLKDPEYIARFAREEFSYSKQDGEYIIKIKNKKPEQIIQEPEEKQNYKLLIGIIGLGLTGIVVYIIKK